jgi:prepilin-type N-terminal cleavage/methylation domain-containing protein/prepilin-type processing-associated H-X9-DG protein
MTHSAEFTTRSRLQSGLDIPLEFPATHVELTLIRLETHFLMKRTPIQTGLLRNSARGRGFTLIELLISITIIIVLAAAVFVMTGKIRAKAQQAKAVSSLRQVAILTASFSGENNGNIHFLRDGGDPLAQGDFVKYSFWGYLKPYLAPEVSTNNQVALRDQLASRVQAMLGTDDLKTMNGTFLRGSKLYADRAGGKLPAPFAFNGNVRALWKNDSKNQSGYKKTQSFSDPSQVLYFTYGFYAFNEEDGRTFAQMPNTNPRDTSNIYWFDNRTAPMAFLDGHVEIVNAPISARPSKWGSDVP